MTLNAEELAWGFQYNPLKATAVYTFKDAFTIMLIVYSTLINHKLTKAQKWYSETDCAAL